MRYSYVDIYLPSVQLADFLKIVANGPNIKINENEKLESVTFKT